jgi:ABC-type transporter Mla subunit MlaD
MSTITSANNREQSRMAGNTSQEASVVDRAKEAVSTAADKVGERAREMASAAADKVSDAASAVSKKADQLTATAGSNIKNFGETIRERGPHEGMLGDATKSVAGTIEAGGKYLEGQGLGGMVDDMAGVIKRNPVPSILVGIGLGILIGRALRS